MKVDVLMYSPRHINAILIEEQGMKKWHFTGFYGHSKTGKREDSWKLLKCLSHRSNLPWVCMGDFNEIMYAREKDGGGVRPKGQMRGFCEAINRCHLRDMGYVGSDYTWSRRLGRCGWIRERLDRALVSTDWVMVFSSMKLFHVSNSTSDHSILMLKDARPPRRQRQRSKLFFFESMWLEDGRCKNVVDEAWERGQNRVSGWLLEACLKECQRSFESWNKHSFGHVGK